MEETEDTNIRNKQANKQLNKQTNVERKERNTRKIGSKC